MRKKRTLLKLLLSLSIIFSLFSFSVLSVSASADDNGVQYLALGDSLAAGVSPYKDLGESYTDMLAEKINKAGFLQSFSKLYAVPGYTSQNVLDDIRNDVKRGEADSIRTSIGNADMITLTIGANDILSKLETSEAGVSIDPNIVPSIIEGIGLNLKQILTEIAILNPDAKVYVMGYYNPFPYLPAEQQKPLLPILKAMNETIQKVAEGAKATYVATADSIAKDFQTNLPNPADVHLSAAGYSVIANEFWRAVVADLTGGAEKSIFINGKQQTFEQKPIIVNNSMTIVHVRGLFEGLGAKVKWNQKDFSILIEKQSDKIIINLKNGTASKNGTPIELPDETKIVNGRTMIPVRFVTEVLSAEVSWEPLTGNVFVVGE